VEFGVGAAMVYEGFLSRRSIGRQLPPRTVKVVNGSNFCTAKQDRSASKEKLQIQMSICSEYCICCSGMSQGTVLFDILSVVDIFVDVYYSYIMR
jgi:hypothetical protein